MLYISEGILGNCPLYKYNARMYGACAPGGGEESNITRMDICSVIGNCSTLVLCVCVCVCVCCKTMITPSLVRIPLLIVITVPYHPLTLHNRQCCIQLQLYTYMCNCSQLFCYHSLHHWKPSQRQSRVCYWSAQ